MRIIVTRGEIAHGRRGYSLDEVLDLPDDEAARIIGANGPNQWVMPEAEAPQVLVTADWRNNGRVFEVGTIVPVSPETLTIMRAYGLGVPWPKPPQQVAPDPVFHAMPADWTGGPFKTVVGELIFCAPEVAAFNATTDGPHGNFALPKPSLVGNMTVALWTVAVWETKAGTKPRSYWKDAPNRNKRGALAWWRQREVDRLACAMFDRLRSGEWLASGVRDDTAEAQRVDILPSAWRHPRYLLKWERYGAALRPEDGAPGPLPHYAMIEVRKPPSISVGTAAAETRCRQWIHDLAVQHPESPPRPKALLRNEAATMPIGASDRAFDRAWGAVAPDAWKKPGRKKSNHRAD
ncbi:hypothetical protein QWZ14_31665 [Paeniroseomonas aquatica]|uniref:DNA primase/polymerase bifunctional N-terminal domain-containing protein n=1 Tax=Paeniroseomonas aquatica TaxID=373043 RepID=A0ABT8AH18_9PROT|nr:hypothetical protein [Paeniroseomonas aquatica]MDN3568960.1 hypothetical protein [Paeniroseomonas aquatica]